MKGTPFQLVLAGLTALLLLSPPPARGEEPAPTAAPAPDQVVAKVNGTAIRQSQVDDTLNSVLRQNPQLGAMMSSPENSRELRARVLEQLVTTELLSQEGNKLKIKDLNTQVEERLQSLKQGFKSGEDFAAALKQQQITEKELRSQIEKGTRIRTLIDQKVKKGISVSDQEVRSFYDENQEKFEEAESVKASHILIKSDKDTDKAQDKKARKKIEALLKRARKGEDFATLARENSEDPSAEKNGGELGYFRHGQMVPEFDKAAFALKPGEISDVVKSSFGYHIIKCEDKRASRQVPFEEVKDRIAGYLEDQAVQAKLAEYVESLKKAGKVEIFAK